MRTHNSKVSQRERHILICTDGNTHSMHCSDANGTQLPTFNEWITQRHGGDYWWSQYENMYSQYISDIFREYHSDLKVQEQRSN